MTNLKELTRALRCGIYVDYGTDLQTAFDAANCYATNTKDPAIFYTALFGVVNTLCNVIDEEIEQETIILDPACAERGCCAHNHLVDPDGVLAVVVGEVNAQEQAEQVQADTHPCGADADQDH